MKKYYIQAISSNLIAALSERAEHDARIIERHAMECLNRRGDYIKQDLFEVPKDIYDEVIAKKNDYQFIQYAKVDDKPPRNIIENFPRPRDDFKIHRKLTKGVIKGTSLLRRLSRNAKTSSAAAKKA